MTSRARVILVTMVLAFVVLTVALILVPAGKAAASPMTNIPDVVEVAASSLPADAPVCTLTGGQAPYGQTGLGLTIAPLQQSDDSSHSLWTTTWRATGLAGTTFQAEVLVRHCFGDIANLELCLYDRALITTTYTVSVTLPVSGTADFSVVDGVTCCEVSEADLTAVNGVPWGASFFDRKAFSPQCSGQPTSTPVADLTKTSTATSTPTGTTTGTPTATPSPTESFTPTSTSTATATLVPTETETETPFVTPTSTETPSETPTATATETETPVPSATATDTVTPTASATETTAPTASPTATATTIPTDTETATATPVDTVTTTATVTAISTETATGTATATPTASATATSTATPTATRTGFYWYFPVILKDQTTPF